MVSCVSRVVLGVRDGRGNGETRRESERTCGVGLARGVITNRFSFYTGHGHAQSQRETLGVLSLSPLKGVRERSAEPLGVSPSVRVCLAAARAHQRALSINRSVTRVLLLLTLAGGIVATKRRGGGTPQFEAGAGAGSEKPNATVGDV